MAPSSTPDAARPGIAVVKAGSTFPDLAATHGDFDDWTRRGIGSPRADVFVVDVSAGDALPDPDALRGTVVTGSHEMVTEPEPWVAPLAAWLTECVDREVPVLGVCYGHQLLAHVLGGGVGYHPGGPEIGSVEAERTGAARGDVLFEGLPARFPVHATHHQTVLELPRGARTLARTAHDGHAAFRVGGWAWGVQFHPEYDETIMRHYVRAQRTVLLQGGRDPAEVEAAVVASPAGSVLERFAAVCARGR